MTSIEWTDKTWNPTRGCARVSPGCENCYAERQAHRFSSKGQPYEGLTRLTKHGPVWTGVVRLVPEMLDAPLRWKKPRRIFVNSMSDLFHEALTDHQIASVFSVMETARARGHVFQVLTKRARRMREWVTEWARKIDYADDSGRGYAGRYSHVWLGVSAEDQQRADERIPDLLATPASVRFVSYEPALGPVDFSRWVFRRNDVVRSLRNGPAALNAEQADDAVGHPLDWVIVGGESGPGARPFDQEWGRSVLQQCKAAQVPCFVKQMGRWVLGDHTGFSVNNWLLEHDGHGGYHAFSPPIIGPNAHKRPEAAIGFSLYDPKGGELEDWPIDLRVREFPRHA